MNWKLFALICFLVILLLLPIFFHLESQKNEKEMAIKKCVEACREAMISGIDLSSGPCLVESIPGLNFWSCDVAHNPRQPIDNLPENQCSSFREGRTKHFVEVDINCNLIRAS